MPRGTHGNHAKGPHHHRWSEDRMIASTGYVKIRVGSEHPLADPNGYAYEHMVVWVAAGRERPARGFTLHHKNEVKTDNRLENLELKRRTEHSIGHHASLSDHQVRSLRQEYADGTADMPTLARRYGVPFQRISKLVRGDTRRDAGGPIVLGDKRRLGKKASGALLDGRLWREVPA